MCFLYDHYILVLSHDVVSGSVIIHVMSFITYTDTVLILRSLVNRGSYISAYVLLNLLNELWKRI